MVYLSFQFMDPESKEEFPRQRHRPQRNDVLPWDALSGMDLAAGQNEAGETQDELAPKKKKRRARTTKTTRTQRRHKRAKHDRYALHELCRRDFFFLVVHLNGKDQLRTMMQHGDDKSGNVSSCVSKFRRQWAPGSVL
jgi:hypothetical protein